MNKLKEYLLNNKLLTDGSFGTYFGAKYNTDILPESFNTSDPGKVVNIHREYIKAGAGIIRTNTFSSNMQSLGCDKAELIQNIKAACANAHAAICDSTVFVVGDIGPIAGDELEVQEEYETIIDSFIVSGVYNFVFETFSDAEGVVKAVDYITTKYSEYDPFIWVQFCVNQYGYSNNGISAARLLDKITSRDDVDAIGLNCGIGPSSMIEVLRNAVSNTDKFISCVPNAGYPKIVSGRPVFRGNEDYFAAKMQEIAALGVDIIGGCCGTNPLYIQKVHEHVSLEKNNHLFGTHTNKDEEDKQRLKDSSFWNGTVNNKLVTVELSPPFGGDDQKVMDAANRLTKSMIDAITIPDSPSGRTRADPVLMGMKIKEGTGINVVPHLCCRDKNMIAMRSYLLGAYLNGVRNFLVITGDPVPTLMRQSVKGVFNFNSVTLMNLIKDMNEEEFYRDPITFGGCINYNRKNMDVELKRILQKMEAGASFFITQPVFTEEDVSKIKYFNDEIKKVNPDIKMICGLMPLVSHKNAAFIMNEMTGINVTQDIVDMFGTDISRAEGEKIGVGIVNNVISMTTDFVDGYYFSIPFNRVALLNDIKIK